MRASTTTPSFGGTIPALRGLVFLLFGLGAAASQACRVPPPGQLIAADEQGRLAQDVAVGQVISATPMGDQEVAPATWRSFEKIDMVNGAVNADDKWLAYVKDELGKRHGFDTGTREGTMPEYERVGRFIYGFHRSVSRDDLDRKTLAGQGAPNELLLRAGRLADEFDRIVNSMKNSAGIPDAELDAALREAADVGAALAAWRKGAGR
jgi:hypothetical protein